MKQKKESLIGQTKYETRKKAFLKFLIALSIFVGYLAFSMIRYGGKNGLLVTIFTWSLFVLCTPIADAGFLVDFPIRLFTKIRMIHTEIVLTVVAILLNIAGFFFFPSIYNQTIMLKVLKLVLANPIPNWIIIILSTIGTFLSIYFADELMDVYLHKDRKKYKKHKNKYTMVVAVFLTVVIIIAYYNLIHRWGLGF